MSNPGAAKMLEDPAQMRDVLEMQSSPEVEILRACRCVCVSERVAIVADSAQLPVAQPVLVMPASVSVVGTELQATGGHG